jgi:chromosome segregation ATPase
VGCRPWVRGFPMPPPTAFLLRSHFRSSFDAVASGVFPRHRCAVFASMSVMWWDDLTARLAAGEKAAARMRIELAGLQYQLDHAQSECKGLRATLLEDARDHAAERLEFRQQLEEQRLQHQQQIDEQALLHAEELAAAVAAETARMQAAVCPTMLLLQDSAQAAVVELRSVRSELEKGQSEREKVQSDLEETRELVWDAINAPVATRRRLGY